MKVSQLLCGERFWCKRHNNLGSRYCLRGAIIACYKDPWPILALVRKRLGMRITEWNDEKKRTFAQVQELVKQLKL